MFFKKGLHEQTDNPRFIKTLKKLFLYITWRCCAPAGVLINPERGDKPQSYSSTQIVCN